MMESLLKRIENNRKAHSRWVALVLCLSMLVSLGTFAGFRQKAVAKTYTKEVLDCPYTHEGAEPVAHVHNDDCYDGEALVCALPEIEAHTHTEECFAEQRTLTCTLAENPGHQHGEGCYAAREENVCGLEENPGHVHNGTCFNDSGVLICTMAEGDGAHTHTADCFTTVYDLVCEIPEGEGAHTHTDECYSTERVMICDKQELPVHVHDAGCIRTEEITVDEPEKTAEPEEKTIPEMPVSDPNADLETAADWEQDFENLELSGNWARDLVLVAATQQGRGESRNNFEAVLNDAGDAWVKHGYTRYGAWYGVPYAEEWSAMFVSFCLRYAGIPEENVPNNPTAAFMAESFQKGELFAGRDYVPAVGDLIFFDTIDDEITTIDHMGIVYHVDAEDGTINTVEGDRTNAVTTFGYRMDDEQIVGYGILPQNPDYVPTEENLNDETAGLIVMTTEEKQETKETTDTEATPVPAAPMPAQSWERTAGGIKVTVDAPEGAFPENTRIAVTPVNGNSLKDTVSDAVSGEVLEVQAVDITFFDADGHEIEPAVPIRVSMTPAATEHAEEKTNVVHVDVAQQTAELIEQAAGTEFDNSEVVFDANAFTIYAIVYTVDTYFRSCTGETFRVTMDFDENAGIPQNAELVVEEILEESADYSNLLSQAENALDGNKQISFVRFFDISIMADGKEVQPLAPVSMKIQLADLPEETTDADAQVIHFGEQPEVLNTEAAGANVSFETSSFSVYGVVYTVDFEYSVNGKMYQFSLPGGEKIALSDLIEVLGIIGDTNNGEKAVFNSVDSFLKEVANVEFSDESLVKVTKNEEGNDWTLESLQAFNTEESLTITMKNGDVLTIKVTDAQLTKDVLTASGETYTITVEYDDDAGIPEGSDLNVREILDGTKEFAGYMVDSAAELSVDSSNITFARFFDIEIVGEHGEKIEPEKPVQVKIEYKDALAIGQEESLSVVHFADDGTEVIDDVVLDMNGTSIKYAQDSFSVTGTVVSGGPRNGQQYMLIAEYEGANYLINNDGTLIPVTDVDPTHIKTDNPMLWTYYYNYGANFRFASEASGFNADQTASGFYYRYLDPNSDSGLREENAANPNLAGATRINYNNYRVSSAADSSKYIGISDEGGTLHVVGNQNSGKAARITLYSADDVKPSDPANHTVNHIDISISGTAQVDVPLAYGIYYYKDGNTWKKIIVGNNVEDVADGAELAARYTNRTEKLAPAQVGITASDMKAATITAKDKNGNVVDNAFYITGYSANEATQWSTDQVRIEGSFKVANLDRPASEFDAWDWWNVNNENVRRARLDNKITYTVEAIKPLELPLTYMDDQGVKHQLYQSMTDDEPMTINAEVPMSASFDYWTYIQGVGNECPPLQPAWGFTTEWQQGGIHPWGISGMDFVLKADVVDVPAKIVALEVSKKIVDEHGNPITNLSAPIDAKFEVYQDKPGDPTTVREVGSEVHDYGTYTKLHDLNVNIATNGSGHRYDYNVSDGMYYIRESRDGLPETIATADGHTYTYIRTEIRTEYSYRANDYRTRDPETGKTIEQTMHETTIASSNANLNSIPEVLGAYTDDNGAPENNEFLEFYFYNVYSETETPPPPEPVYKTLDIEIDKKWQDGETIVDPSQVDGTITFYLHQIQTQNNSSTTDATGSGYPKTFTVRAADGWKLTIPDLPWYETDTHDSYVKTYQYYLEEDTSKATGSASNYKAPSFTNGYGSINSPVTSDTEDDVVRVEVVNKTGNVLRIQKRWLNVDPETAPNVRITLYRQGVKESGDPINGYQPEEIRVIDLSDSNRVQGENWWQLEIPFPADTTFKYPEGNQEHTGHYVYYISENRTNNKNENISNDFQDPRYITLVGNQVIDDYRAYNLVTNGQGINYENSQWNPRKDKQYIINGESVPLYASSTDQKDTTMIVMNNPKNNFDQLRFSKKWYKVASNGQMTQANSTELNQYAIGIQIYQKLDADGYDWVPYAAPFYIASSTSVINNNNNTPYIMSADMPFKFNGNPQNTNGEWTWNIIRGDDASPGFPQYATINGQQINYKYEAREIGVYKNPQYPNGVSNADQLERVFDYSNTQEWSFDRNHTQPQGINVEAGKLKVTKEWQGNNVGSCIYFHVFQGNKDITDDIVANYDNYGLSEYQVYDDGTHKALIVKSDGENWEELLIQGLAMAPSGGGTPYQYSIQEIGYSEADGTNCWDGEAVINSDGTTRTDPHGNTVITHISELLTGYQIDSNGVSEPVNGRSGATSVTGNTVHEITVKNKYEEKYKDLEITKIWTDQLGNYLTWDQDITVDLYNGNNLIAENILLFITPPDQQATKSFVIDGVTYNWEVSLDASGKVYTFRFKDLPAKINNQEAVYSVVEKELTGFETLYGFISDGQFRPNTNGESASDGQTIKNMKVELGGPELPSTGGPGTRLFTIIGSILILGAGVLLWRRRRLI